jgi:hypothetical protein
MAHALTTVTGEKLVALDHSPHAHSNPQLRHKSNDFQF